MQTMLNYGNLTSPAATSPFMQSLLAQYNYPGSSQQYMDMLSLYSKYAQSPLAYTELNASMTGSAYHNTSASPGFPLGAPGPTSNVLKPPSTSTAAMHEAAALKNNPLSALGDLSSLYGMNTAKNYPGLGGKQPPSLFLPHTAAPTTTTNIYSDNSALLPPSYAGAGVTNTTAAGAGKPTSQSVGSPFPNLYSYANDYTQPGAPNSMNMNYGNSAGMHLNPMYNASAAAAALAAAKHVANYKHASMPYTPSAATSSGPVTTMPQSGPKANTVKSAGEHNMPAALSPRTIDLTKALPEQSVGPHAKLPPLIDLTRTQQTAPDNRNVGNAGKNRDNQPKNSARSTPTSTANMTTINSSSAPSTTTTTALTKRTPRQDSPKSQPHPISLWMNAVDKADAAEKQSRSPVTVVEPLKKLNNEMLIIPTTSPPGTTSISKQFSEISPSISLTAVRPTTTNTTNNNNSSNNKGATQTYLPLSNGKTSNISNKLPYNVNAYESLSATATNTPKAVVSKMPTISVAKFANTGSVAQQINSNSNSNSNNNNNNNSTTKKVPAELYKNTLVSSPMSSSMAAAAAKRPGLSVTQKKPPASSMPANSVLPKRNTPYPPLSDISVNTTAKRVSPTTLNRTSIVPTSTTAPPKPTTMAASLSPSQLQKLRAIGANTPPLASGTKPFIIRPADAGYIIETKINEKRVAIGAPTRSGGGTTVTKIALPTKRKPTDASDVADNKRQKDS